MSVKTNNQIRKFLYGIMLVGTILSLCFGVSSLSGAHVQEGGTPEPNSEYFTTNTIMLDDGRSIDEYIINGPPTPPAGYELERAAVDLPGPNLKTAIHSLTVPAFNWSFGCSATSGAMIAGYYDRTGFPNMYTGPTNSGVMPLDNSSWPNWTDGHGDTYGQNPLAASHLGLDGRATRGSIDDYWVSYLSGSLDPYITNGWTQHTWGDAIGDYMKTSQSAYSNDDGSTAFYNWSTLATRLTCADMATGGISGRDGTYGRKLFYEARGYTVTDCYNQKTDNNGGGFTLALYKAEIDAGWPVMLNLAGHTVVGVGYDDSSSTIYIHDTWDYSDHSMIWGGSYSGMALKSVSIVNIQTAPTTTPTNTPTPTATSTSTKTLTSTPTNTPTTTPTNTPTNTFTPTSTTTNTPTRSYTPTPTSTTTNTPTRTYTPTPTNSFTPTPTQNYTLTPTNTYRIYLPLVIR